MCAADQNTIKSGRQRAAQIEADRANQVRATQRRIKNAREGVKVNEATAQQLDFARVKNARAKALAKQQNRARVARELRAAELRALKMRVSAAQAQHRATMQRLESLLQSDSPAAQRAARVLESRSRYLTELTGAARASLVD